MGKWSRPRPERRYNPSSDGQGINTATTRGSWARSKVLTSCALRRKMRRRVVGLYYCCWVVVGCVLPHEETRPWWPEGLLSGPNALLGCGHGGGGRC